MADATVASRKRPAEDDLTNHDQPAQDPAPELPSLNAPAPHTVHPWVGVWDLFASEACAAGKCSGKTPCRPEIPGLEIKEESGFLTASNFTLRGLKDPMAGEPFSYGTAVVRVASAAAPGGATFSFDGEDCGCGIESVTCELLFKADAAAGGAPALGVKLSYDVRLGRLYLRKGHESWEGVKHLGIKKRS